VHPFAGDELHASNSGHAFALDAHLRHRRHCRRECACQTRQRLDCAHAISSTGSSANAINSASSLQTALRCQRTIAACSRISFSAGQLNVEPRVVCRCRFASSRSISASRRVAASICSSTYLMAMDTAATRGRHPLDRIVQVGQRMAEGDTFQHLCDLVF
jgi:hypothetical protein